MTSSEPAIGAWPNAKLERARAHLADLETHIGEWLATDPYQLESVIAEDRLSWRLILHLDTPPPVVHWATITGDCLHNLRSALDAAVWELANTDGGAPARPRAVQFPFAESHEDWMDKSARMLAGLPPEVLRRIESAQPYNHTPSNDRMSALALLNLLDIEDKHRAGVTATINPTQASRTGQIQFESDEAAARHSEPNHGVLPEMRDGAILHEATTTEPIVNVRGEFNATLIIAIATPRGPSPLVRTIQLLDQAVAIALNALYGYIEISVAGADGLQDDPGGA